MIDYRAKSDTGLTEQEVFFHKHAIILIKHSGSRCLRLYSSIQVPTRCFKCCIKYTV